MRIPKLSRTFHVLVEAHCVACRLIRVTGLFDVRLDKRRLRSKSRYLKAVRFLSLSSHIAMDNG
jgi:hypothetical protein